jgi:hypothetical protein
MALNRDIERLVRTFIAQHLERAYIKHYLMETYQLPDQDAEQVLVKMGLPPEGGPRRGPATGDGGGRVKKQSFF